MDRAESSWGPRGECLGIALASSVVGLLLLLPVLHGLPFADDWANRVDDPFEAIRTAFVSLRPYELYRPLQTVAIATSEIVSGGSFFLHLIQVAVHSMLIAICWTAMAERGASRTARVITAAYLAASQLNGSALGGNDTFSLVLGTTAGTGAVLLAARVRSGGGGTLSASAVCLAIALLAKESSMGYVPIIVALLLSKRSSARTVTIPERVIAILVPILLAIAYLGWRGRLGAASLSFDEGSPFAFGQNLLINAIQVLFAATAPISTTDLFRAAHFRDWGLVVAGGLGAAAVAIVCIFGLLKIFGARSLPWILAGAIMVISPILFMRHVSELYAYALLPMVAVGFGGGIAEIVARAVFPARLAAIVFMVLVLTGNARALRADARSMAENGRRSAALMDALVQEIRSLPAGSRMTLVNPPSRLPEYSVFRMTNFRLVPEDDALELAGRTTDVTIEVRDTRPDPAQLAPNAFVYTMTDDFRLIRLP